MENAGIFKEKNVVEQRNIISRRLKNTPLLKRFSQIGRIHLHRLLVGSFLLVVSRLEYSGMDFLQARASQVQSAHPQKMV